VGSFESIQFPGLKHATISRLGYVLTGPNYLWSLTLGDVNPIITDLVKDIEDILLVCEFSVSDGR
jgi:hypothetical protein